MATQEGSPPAPSYLLVECHRSTPGNRRFNLSWQVPPEADRIKVFVRPMTVEGFVAAVLEKNSRDSMSGWILLENHDYMPESYWPIFDSRFVWVGVLAENRAGCSPVAALQVDLEVPEGTRMWLEAGEVGCMYPAAEVGPEVLRDQQETSELEGAAAQRLTAETGTGLPPPVLPCKRDFPAAGPEAEGGPPQEDCRSAPPAPSNLLVECYRSTPGNRRFNLSWQVPAEADRIKVLVRPQTVEGFIAAILEKNSRESMSSWIMLEDRDNMHESYWPIFDSRFVWVGVLAENRAGCSPVAALQVDLEVPKGTRTWLEAGEVGGTCPAPEMKPEVRQAQPGTPESQGVEVPTAAPAPTLLTSKANTAKAMATTTTAKVRHAAPATALPLPVLPWKRDFQGLGAEAEGEGGLPQAKRCCKEAQFTPCTASSQPEPEKEATPSQNSEKQSSFTPPPKSEQKTPCSLPQESPRAHPQAPEPEQMASEFCLLPTESESEDELESQPSRPSHPTSTGTRSSSWCSWLLNSLNSLAAAFMHLWNFLF